MPRPYLRKLIPVLIIAGAVLISILMRASHAVPERKNVIPPLPIVKTLVVEKGAVPVTIVAYGNVNAEKVLELTSEVSGRVVEIGDDFQPGKKVAKGTVLLKIENTDYRLAVAEANARLATAELTLADAKVQRSTARIAEAKASVEAARLGIAQAAKNLRNTVIKAPFNAVIDTQLVELGQYIQTGKNFGRVFGSDSAEIRLPIIAADVGYLSESATPNVLISAKIGQYEQRWQGYISTIEARVDQRTRVFPVVVTVDSPLDSKHLTPLSVGLFVKAEIPGLPVQDAQIIPRSALHEDDTVYIFSEGQLQKRPVVVVRTAIEGVVISDGVEDGEHIVLSQLEVMFNGMEVALTNE